MLERVLFQGVIFSSVMKITSDILNVPDKRSLISYIARIVKIKWWGNVAS